MTASAAVEGSRPLARATTETLRWVVIAALPLAVAVIALGLGRYGVEPQRVLGILASPFAPIAPFWTATDETVVLVVRLPRILIAAICGAGLGAAGAALQGLFRNPLVGPQVLGLSSGAGFGGALALLFGASGWLLVGAAFVGTWAALGVVLMLARAEGRVTVLMLVLAGIVVGALFSAATSLCVFVADPEQRLPGIVFWLLGSFAAADGQKLTVAALATLPGLAILVALAWRIDVLSLGDEDARALGQPVEALRLAILSGVALIVAGQVAISGVIGWVGLVVPHLARGVVGPDHRRLMPASILIGAAYMIVADTLARTLAPAEIPLGILTAIVGAPLFALLLRRIQKRSAFDG
jgi:iron complex transport system permease protein